MKKEYAHFQVKFPEFDISENIWLEKAIDLLKKKHLICIGKKWDLQWFGTSLIQKCSQLENAETSAIYGKLTSTFDDFCYQLCHSTPWGFEMGRNLNAVNDVLRGENDVKNKCLVWYDAGIMYKKEFETFKEIFHIMLNRSEEEKNRKSLFRVILLFNQENEYSFRKLLKNKEKHPIELIRITSSKQE